MQKFNEEAIEFNANEVALYNPGFAIRGWLSGARAIGDEANVRVYERALELQDSWRVGPGDVS